MPARSFIRGFVRSLPAVLYSIVGAMSWAADGGTNEKKGLAAITLPQGFSVEMAAGAPLIERPMLASFDDRGRLYVADSAGVNLRGPELSKNPPHVIRMLEDTDGDGRFDKSTVFADKMVFPQGVVWHDGAVYCSSPPSFWRLEDTDDDGVADQREELVTGFANTGVADDMHGGSLGPDGRLYWCAGRFPHHIRRPGGPVIHEGTAPLIVRCRPDGSELEVVSGSQGNAVGVVFTPRGDMFASGTFLAPNSMGAGLRDALVHCIDGAEYPVRDRTLNEHKRTGELLPPLTHLGVAAASDLMICRGDALGEDARGNLFSALFNMHKIMRHRLERAGATFKCRNEDFLVSSDPDFHPTDVFEDADGSMLVIDTGGWFRIGCPTSQIAKPEVMGAIYRVRKSGTKPLDDPRGLRIAWNSLSAGELVRSLDDARFEVRDRAIGQLAKLGPSAVGALAGAVSGNGSLQSRCNAVWALTRIDGDDARLAVRTALTDAKPSVRQAAARSAGLHRDRKALEPLMAIVTSDEPPVRREAATALGRIGETAAVGALLDGLNSAGDRFLEHALIFALIRIGDRPNTLTGLAMAGSGVKRGALIALDQMDGGQLTPDVVTPFLEPTDPLMRETALWVITHHGDWGRAMLDFFVAWLARSDMDDARRDELKLQLLAFVKDTAVQALIATTLSDSRTQLETRLLLLEVMAQAGIAKLPAIWIGPLRQALENGSEPVVRQAVATLRAIPLDKRPLVSRIDAQINFEETEKRFAGTRLSENFCVRWAGTIRCPKHSTYTFYTESDDGSQLFVDGKLVVDNGGAHAMREKQGHLELTTGDHDLRIEFLQGEGEAGCKMAWAFDDRAKEIIPADVLWHRPRSAPSTGAALLVPGLVAEFFELGGPLETFPNLAASEFDDALLRVALDAGRPMDIRVQAAAAVAPRLGGLDGALFGLLLSSLDQQQTPLVRLDAAEALGKGHLDDAQLKTLCGAVAAGGVLEVPKLLQAFEQSKDAQVGEALVAALARSAGLKSLRAETLLAALEPFGSEIRQKAEPLLQQLSVNTQKQQARLAELQTVLAGGEIQRGRDLFFGNKKAICATCHAVQGLGGKFGPDLTKIGAIRTSRDLLEAIVFPSASFARGYEPLTVATDEGQVISGTITRETADAIYLFNNSRVEVRVSRSSIESLSQSTVSIMPEGMDVQLGPQELADLIAFLGSLR
jgi:putative membrane-bound dehydrogenase-like protein